MVAPFLLSPRPGGRLWRAATAWTSDPDRTVPALLVLFVLVWTAYSSLSRYNLDLHGDMVENYAWGIAWQLGYYKHPPLFSWIAAAWFEIFPREKIFYHLLASANVGVALLALWRISRRFLDGNQQILLVASAFFLPCLTFLAANYNATSAMLPFWSLTVLFYIRTLERRSAVDAVLTGAIAAAAVLVKYHSVVIPLTLAAHMLIDPRARRLLLSPLPWLATLAGFAVLSPHLVWLVRMDFPTLRYAEAQGDILLDAVTSAASFVPVMLLYALPAFGFLGLLRRPGDGLPVIAVAQITALRATLAGRAFLAALVLPAAFTMILGIITEGKLSSLWTIPFFALLPLPIVLCLPKAAARRAPTQGLLMVAAYSIVLLGIAPFIRDATLDRARSYAAVPLADIAGAGQKVWHDRTGRRLTIVAGTRAPIVNAFAFHAPDRPFAVQAMSLESTPWVTPAMIAADGAMAICDVRDAACVEQARTLLGHIDETTPLSVPAVPGAAGPESWTYTLLLRHPGQAGQNGPGS